MRKKILISVLSLSALIYMAACGNEGEGESTAAGNETTTAESSTDGPPSYDPHRGEGKFDESNLKIGPLDPAMAEKGEAIAVTKCNSCHKYTEERLVGPGWAGVTERRTPYWIMNFITNPDPMIDKDPELQAQLELCLVRMPDQNLMDDEARQILEFMRQNDGAK